jgi:hypothetical protein
MSNIKTARQMYEQFMQSFFEKIDSIGDEVMTTEDIQELAVQNDVEWQSIASINNMLTDFGYGSKPLKNSAERIWFVKGK